MYKEKGLPMAGKRGMTGASKKTGTAGQTVKKSAVVTNVSEDVSGMIEYETISQILERDAENGEIFAIGDAMPIYYL